MPKPPEALILVLASAILWGLIWKGVERVIQ